MKKHAYLIMAHNNFGILKKLLSLLDDPRNDIYIHIDKKVKSFDFDQAVNVCQHSSVQFTDKRIDVRWGEDSQVKTELLLYKTASKYNYKYYHLLSGVDLPLKTQNEIHDFFENDNRQFIFYYDVIKKIDYQRLSRYHFPKTMNTRIVTIFNVLQEKLSIDRIKKYNMTLKRGYNWCSLTHDAVLYLLEHERFIKKICKFSVCADECYKQFLFYNSSFKNRIYIDSNGNPNDMRAVDWSRRVGNSPHIYTIDDLQMLLDSDKFFARKFDENTDSEIVDAIVNNVKARKSKI